MTQAFLFRGLAALTLSMLGVGTTTPADLPVVEANDNRTPAGSLGDDTLRIRLIVKMARWYPEGADGPHVDVAVFAEEGKSPSIPGPLIRVIEGTTVVATVRNELSDSILSVTGLMRRPASKPDELKVRPGNETTVTFNAGSPGTYLYFARVRERNTDFREREQLAGAFVVDARGARTDDRIFMINIWGEPRDSGS